VFLLVKSLFNSTTKTTEPNPTENFTYTPEFISPNISWKKSLSSYVPSNYQGDIESIQKAVSDKYKNKSFGDQYLAIDLVNIKNDWLQLEGTSYYKETNETVPTEGTKLYGEKLTSGWKIYSSGDDLCGYAKRAPKDWVDPFFLEDCK
jgi:hypothetical protein